MNFFKSGILAGIITGLCACGGGSDTPEIVTTPAATPTPTSPSSPTVTASPQTYRIGNAVAPINYWMNAWTLNDVAKTSGFVGEEGSGESNMFVPVVDGQWMMDDSDQIAKDEHGWPTSLTLNNGVTADQLTFLVLGSATAGANPAGDYQMTYTGQGTFTVSNAVVSDETDGALTLSYSGEGEVFINITSTDPNNTGDYLRDISILRPDALASDRFHPDYLSYLQPFSVIRPLHMIGDELVYSMPDSNGEYSYVRGDGAWERRKQITDSHWGGSMGAPYEMVIDLANQSDSDLWLNVPVGADDEYVRQLATLMHDELNEDRVLYVELGNELWNWDYPYAIGREYAFNAAQARWPGVYGTVTDYAPDGVSENMMIFSWQGARTIEVGEIFEDVWGEDADRLGLILAGQYGSSGVEWPVNRQILEAPVYVAEEDAEMPGLQVSALAVGAYVSDPYQEGQTLSENGFDRTSPETYISEAIHYVNGTDRFVPGSEEPGMRFQTRQDKALADEFGIAMVAYEGGHHFIGSVFTRDVASVDPMMYDLYQSLFSMWEEEGGGLFVHLHGIIPRGESPEGEEPGFFESENFGIKETQQQTEADAPRFHALMDIMRALGQAD